jgi:hypothetical protein
MRAQFIFEKFEDESDPIKDMGIGGTKINFTNMRNEMPSKTDLNKWLAFFSSLEGKTIVGELKNNLTGKAEKVEFKISSSISKFWGTEIHLYDNNDSYTVINKENYLVY